MADRIKGLTLQINGDTTKLSSALKGVNSELRDTQSALKDVEKLLKVDPGNVELLKQKHELLGKAIDETKDKLKTLKEAQSQMKAEGVDANSKAYQNLQREIIATEQELKKLEKQANSSNAVLQKIGAEGEKLVKAGNKLSGVGQKLLPVTAGVAALGTAAVKTAADFDASMSKVAAVSGAAGEEFDALRDKAREMGSKTKFSATEAADAMNYMAMAGWKTEDMLNGVEGIMNLAAASGEELATTSDIVTDALTAFGMSAEESSRFADILAAASSNANTNVSMMGESFKYVAPVAGALGYSAEDISIALGLMANSGIKASMAGTTLRNLFQRMAKPTDEVEMAMDRLGIALYNDQGEMYSFREIMDQLRGSMQNINAPLEEYEAALDELDQQLEEGTLSQKKYDKALEELNLETFGAEGAEKARAAAMLGGARAMSGLLAIANATEEDYQKLTDAIDNSSQAFAKTEKGIIPLNEAMEQGLEIIETYQGSAEAMAATMQDNLEGQITILKSQLQELAISLADMLMPTIRAIVGYIQNLVDWLNSLDDGTKQIIVTIALVLAAVGPVLIMIGKVVASVGSIMTTIPKIGAALTALMANPVALWIAGITGAIVGVIAIGVTLYKHWDEIKAKATELKEHLAEKFNNIKEVAAEKFGEMKEKCTDAFNKIKESASEKWNATKEAIQKGVSAATDTVNEKLNNIKDAFERNGGGIKGLTAATWESIKSYYSLGFSFLDKLTGGKLSELVDKFKNKFADIINSAKTWGQDLINNFVQGIKDKIGAVGDAVKGVAQKVADFLHFSEPDEGPLSDFHTFMPDMIDMMAKGINESLYKLNQPLDALGNKVASSTQVDVNYNDSALTGRLDTINNSIIQGGQSIVKVELAPNIQNLFRALKVEGYRQEKALGGV